MANPIMKRTNEVALSGPTFSDFDGMREWCWKWNEQTKEARWANWLYVSEDKENNTRVIKVRTGGDAVDVLKLIDGWYPDFYGWEPERLASEFRILRHIARMGMPEDKFQTIRFAYPPRQLAEG
jgi:hypothetical protein